jgi:hypothetical protein
MLVLSRIRAFFSLAIVDEEDATRLDLRIASILNRSSLDRVEFMESNSMYSRFA